MKIIVTQAHLERAIKAVISRELKLSQHCVVAQALKEQLPAGARFMGCTVTGWRNGDTWRALYGAREAIMLFDAREYSTLRQRLPMTIEAQF